VVDTGVARFSRYSFRSGFQRLPIEAISQASANQRTGRCGRVGPGVCLRLYSEEDFNSRPEFTDAEIRRSNLAAVVLRMLQLRLGAVENFPFLDRPDSRLVKDAYRRLWELGATNPRQQLSKLGRRMAAFPIDPGFARMILAAERENVVAEVLIVASALSIQDPRERPTDRQAQADQSHARFRDPRSDFVGLILLWRYYEEQRQLLSENQLRKLCRREYLSWLRMREWRDVHRQLVINCRQQGLAVAALERESSDEQSASSADTIRYDRVHRAILTGLISNIAQQDERREYRAARNRGLVLFPGSALYKKPPKWLVAGEIVETEKVYARTAAAIQPEWLLTANPKLLKHSYYEPRWEKRSGRVVAWRRSTLFGLTVSDRVPVHYAREDPVLCRELLIREGLISGNWHAPPPFLKHNLKLCRTVEDLESRLRRRDVLRDDQALFELYDQRVPDDVVSAISLQDALKKQPNLDAKLRFRRDEIITRDPGDVEDQFPSELHWDGISYRLRYEFSPNSSADGVSVQAPIALLNRLPRQRLEWLVPGLLREKCIAMVKGLPKAVRRQLVPVPDWVDRALAQLEPDNVSLAEALGRVFSELGSVRLSGRDFEGVAFDDYYRMNLQILDDKGRMLAEGRDIDTLIERFAEKTRDSLRSGSGDSPARSGLQQWDFGELAKTYDTRSAGTALRAYPALVDQQNSVEIALFDYPAQAHIAHRSGVARLLMLQHKALFRDLRKRLLRGNTVMLQLARLELDREELINGLLPAIALESAGSGSSDCRQPQAFEAYSKSVARGAVSTANDFERYLLQGLALWDSSVARATDKAYAVAISDLNEERKRLLAATELAASVSDELRHYPRYAKAADIRAERLAGNFRKDQDCQARLNALLEPLAEMQRKVSQLGLVSVAAREYEIMLREFRVSLFAQHLGTSRPVSEKRLKAHWQTVESWYQKTRGQIPEK
ncbi:MAG: ATP-dependent RNA helicase HrpA, partial [Pseudomonadota bacterium]